MDSRIGYKQKEGGISALFLLQIMEVIWDRFDIQSLWHRKQPLMGC